MYERTFSGALGPYFSQIKQIAAGGNGRILSGIDTRFDFPVCIKRISVANKDECRAALREIRIRRRLRHENIVGLLNAIIWDGTDISEISPANFRDTSCIYLVQELLDADLRQVIESHTRLSDEYVKLFFYQLLRGLKYIHSANVLHRDLKPSNIMININSLQLMIGDFGHSMVLDPEYNHGTSLTACDTSLWYKAPELILGTAQYSTASDIWAVGCILAEMLLARPLFEGENDLEQLELIIHAIKAPQKDQSHIRTYLTEEVNTMYSGEPKFPLQSKFQKVDCQALHLLEHLLSFNPDDRVTTELALSHPFLKEYACVADEPVCLKPLHLEHEVDDFLEYTLKDLIVGECVALAEEQPRIHLQMSSYSSLTDITKECSVSPSESASQSTEERYSLELKTVSEDYHEVSNENECNRFKVLEVLKEEHGSSSDSNGLAAHEERVSEAPLVLDHPMFSSSKWEKERHKSGHRRHHHHRRKKKFHLKSPSSEIEPSLDSNGERSYDEFKEERLPEIHVPRGETPGNHVPRLNSPEEERCLSPMVDPPNSETSSFILQSAEGSPPVPNSDSPAVMQAQDDKVQELIMRSCQLIANQTVNGVPAITDICESLPSKSTVADICSTGSPKYAPTDVCCAEPSKEISVVPMEIVDEKPIEKNFSSSVGALSVLSHHRSAVDLGVAEVIRRSQELLGEVYRSNAVEEKSLVADESDHFQDLISRSERLLKSNLELQIVNVSEHSPCPPDENSSLAVNGSDPVKDLIPRSQPLLKSNETTEQLRTTRGNTGVNIEHSRPESTLEDKSYNYPPPFTDKCLHLATPSVNHLLANNPSIHSCVKDKVDTPWVITYPQPTKDGNTLQPMLSDPYHLKESSRRMRELLEESHTLVSSLKTDQLLCPEAESGLKYEDQYGKIPCEEKLEEFSQRETNKKENFDKSLDGIDLQEMKLVLDQAKKLLEKPNEFSGSNEKVSSDVDQSVNCMEIDENAEENEDNEVKCTRMEIDNECGNECGNVKYTTTEVKPDLYQDESTTAEGVTEINKGRTAEDGLKYLSCFQNQVDFIDVVSEPPVVSHQAAMFGVVKVKVVPPLEKQTLRFNCLTRSLESTVYMDSKSTTTTEGYGDLQQCTVERCNHFLVKQVLVKKRSNETVSDDYTHKHFKNSGVTSPDVYFSTAAVCDTVEGNLFKGIGVVESRKHLPEDDSTEQLRLNGINTSTFDLNVDKTLIADSNYKPDLAVFKNQVENGKYSPKYDSLEGNRNAYSNRVIEQLNSDEVVDKLCGNTCRMENNTKRLNSKDTGRLQNFYATLKIKSIMRPLREKRHDTYPF